MKQLAHSKSVSLSVNTLLDKAFSEVLHFTCLFSDYLKIVKLGKLIAAGSFVVESVILVNFE